MSVQEGGRAGGEAFRYEDDDRGYGWMLFAGAMLGMVAVINFVEGIAAISQSHFFVGHAHYVFGDLKTWGWVILILGIAQGLAAIGIFVKNQLARWAGVVFALANAIAQLLSIPAYPFWALALFTVDILIVYGLIAHGKRYYLN
jgi:hypothetical protein